MATKPREVGQVLYAVRKRKNRATKWYQAFIYPIVKLIKHKVLKIRKELFDHPLYLMGYAF